MNRITDWGQVKVLAEGLGKGQRLSISKIGKVLTWRIGEIKPCQDCGCKHPEPYGVSDELWAAAGMVEGVLCLDCLQKRIGRDLTIFDFTNYPINEGIRFGYNLGRDLNRL